MNTRILLAIVASSSLMTACSGGAALHTAASPFDPPRSAAEIAREAKISAQTQEKIRSGMSFQFRSESAVLTASGTDRVLTGAGGQSVQILLVPRGQRTLAIRHLDTSGARSAQYVDEFSCDDCFPPGGPTPAPPPPNAGACHAAGGAAWEDAEGGVGCLGSGSSRDLSCGTWMWISPGRGRLYPNYGEITVSGDWIDDSGGGTCTIG